MYQSNKVNDTSEEKQILCAAKLHNFSDTAVK
jgi:hypothetical protein